MEILHESGLCQPWNYKHQYSVLAFCAISDAENMLDYRWQRCFHTQKKGWNAAPVQAWCFADDAWSLGRRCKACSHSKRKDRHHSAMCITYANNLWIVLTSGSVWSSLIGWFLLVTPVMNKPAYNEKEPPWLIKNSLCFFDACKLTFRMTLILPTLASKLGPGSMLEF